MYSKITETSWISSYKEKHCITHGYLCHQSGLGLDCARFITTIYIFEPGGIDPIIKTYTYRTAQECWNSHPIRLQAAMEWVRKTYPNSKILYESVENFKEEIAKNNYTIEQLSKTQEMKSPFRYQVNDSGEKKE